MLQQAVLTVDAIAVLVGNLAQRHRGRLQRTHSDMRRLAAARKALREEHSFFDSFDDNDERCQTRLQLIKALPF